MEKITKVTQADVGRIAVSLDGDFRVQLMSISQNEQGNNHVKYVEGNQFSPERVGQETLNFGLIGGYDAMYWEDEVKPKKPKTPKTPITQVTDADVGRIAVSEDGYFKIRILVGDGDSSTIEFLKATSLHEKGDISAGFGLVDGGRTMFWESNRASTPFEFWCAENGYDPKGEFVYDQTSPAAIYSLSFKEDSVLKICYDDNSLCPRFEDKLGNEKFEYFNSHDIYLQQHIKVAKPRFHKKRQKPPVRQKTDVVIHYKTGESYTIKDVVLVSVNQDQTQIMTNKSVTDGVSISNTATIENSIICNIQIKTPNDSVNIHFSYIGTVVRTKDTYSVGTFWSRTFK